MKHLKEYVVYKNRKKFSTKPNFNNRSFWYNKMVNDVAEFYYDGEVTFLNCGAYGEVFIFNNVPSKVLKITTDEDEIALVEKMRKLPELKHVINYYDVRKIQSEKVSDNTYWAILMDRIIPIREYKGGRYRSIYEFYTSYTGNFGIERSKLADNFKNKWSWENFWRDNKDNFDPRWNKSNKLTENQLKDFVLQVQEAVLELNKYNLIFLDDAHAGNVGFKTNGNFCYYDMKADYYKSKIKLKPIKTR
jgi:hypothetical protein